MIKIGIQFNSRIPDIHLEVDSAVGQFNATLNRSVNSGKENGSAVQRRTRQLKHAQLLSSYSRIQLS